MKFRMTRFDKTLTAIGCVIYAVGLPTAVVSAFAVRGGHSLAGLIMIVMGCVGFVYVVVEGVRLSSPLLGLGAGAIAALPVALVPWIVERFDTELLALGLLTIALPGAVFGAGFSWLMSWLKAQTTPKEAPSRQQGEKPSPKGIGGWLILPAIGFGLSPVVFLVGLFMEIEQRSPTVMPVSYGVLVAFSLLVAYVFFRKKRGTPAIVFAFLIALPVFHAVQAMVYGSCGESLKRMMPFVILSLIGSVASASIWIPYFAKSKRVKATFVE